jgi:protein phosphatase/serine/threonine-protein phosphatase Stp1
MTSFRSSGATHAGARRDHNEDRYVERPDLGLWAVADGAGGHSAGELASAITCEALHTIPPGLDAAELLDQVHHRLLAAHAAMREEAARRGPRTTIASTVAVLLVREAHFAVLWAGDSRAYLLRDGILTQLTRDHSLAQELVAAGALEASAAASHPRANIITRALGAGEELVLDKAVGDVLPGDRFLLCSDGLNKTLPNAEIVTLLAPARGLAPTERLIAAALARDADDNVTAVVAEAINPVAPGFQPTIQG